MEASLLLVIAVLVALAAGWQRLRRLEAEVADLRARLERAHVEPARAPEQPPLRAEYAADVAAFVRTPTPLSEPTPAEPPPAGPPPAEWLPDPALPIPDRPTFESIVGARLPIWVGGAALVVAGFFLVRYSIDSGLLGPAVRVALAALFSILLVAGGELAGRLPGLRDDARVGQALTGAGIASAYGTLYIAVAQYALVGAGAGFALTVLVTTLALALSLRQGPPTAVMALIGGFAAPLVAGVGAGQLGALLAYLAVFIAALFALAAWRGWAWLAFAAVGAGFAWANLIVVLLSGADTAGVAAFVVALAIAGTLALPRTGVAAAWLRMLPLVIGLVQLIVLAPALDFDAIAWSFHLILAAAAVILARRDPTLAPAAIVAAALVAVLIAAGLSAPERAATPIAAIVATALFGGSGLAWSRRARAWAWVAILGLGAPVLASHAIAPDLLPKAGWTLVELLLASAAGALAWRHRALIDQRDPGLVGGTALAAVLAATGLATIVGLDHAPTAVAIVLAALGWWGNRIPDRDLARLPTIALAAIALLAFRTLGEWAMLIGFSVIGTPLTYPLIPPLGDIATAAAIPALVGAALFAFPRTYAPHRPRVAAALAIVATLVLYSLAKQPLAIADDARFRDWGFHERAAITLLLAAAGVALVRFTRLVRTGAALVALAIARAVWFDLLVHSPLTLAQRVGSIPVLNTAVLLPALLALAAEAVRWRKAALALTLVATLAAVRQATHGSILTGPLGSGETWLYSAALLALAIVWLWRGLATGDRTTRLAALALLTTVTVKVFLIDVAALGGLLRILSFLGLGLALIGIGWTYARVIARPHPSP
ncbi:DUF2339 domain-containing protein [Sphingomonas floccifaciens]|uniref:DUF2339 domain-containing protein n=1 Tax=Sphingomonas floccifaciens TaxID=1844115 RepID=A0ABW4NE16_9SPHN